ncbi:hypothetical protein [Helicobacter cinaedi]|uniref:hypothetical protein n=1 Tax=Helicobacter cinaedi TaxID=213 RepID=UPI001F3EAF39|nr:hypothetical protein [Helicobacter cinaedi]
MTQHIEMALSTQEVEILHECDELTLDFTSLNKDSISVIPPQCVVIGYGDFMRCVFISLCRKRAFLCFGSLTAFATGLCEFKGAFGSI